METGAESDLRELVVLVDESGRELGTATKLSVHVSGRLHRAVSVFVFDGEGRALLQRRAAGKYHSGSLWSNTCCGHPRPGEPPVAAAYRRLREEIGVRCPLAPAFSFVYHTALENGLIEHEHDEVFVGRFDGTPVPCPQEVEDWSWVTADELIEDVAVHPSRYSAWFPIALRELLARGVPEQDLRWAV